MNAVVNLVIRYPRRGQISAASTLSSRTRVNACIPTYKPSCFFSRCFSYEASPKAYKYIPRGEMITCVEEIIEGKNVDIEAISEEIRSSFDTIHELREKDTRMTRMDAQHILGLEGTIIPELFTKKKRIEAELKTELYKLQELQASVSEIPSIRKSLWNGYRRDINGPIFPEESFGSIVLTRDRVLMTVVKLVQEQALEQPNLTRSVYMCGCRGMGKTSNLAIIGDYYLKIGHEVYYYKSSLCIPFEATEEFDTLLELYLMDVAKKKVVIIIDHIESMHKSPLFVSILKGTFPNLIVIGAAIPTSPPLAYFKRKLEISEQVLRLEDADYLQVVDYVTKLHVASPSVTVAICNYILEYCGGHVYPTLRFIEIFFTSPEFFNEYLQSTDTFRLFFHSSDFVQSEYYERVLDRTFRSGSLVECAASNFLSGKHSFKDIFLLEEYGWLDNTSKKLISKLLENNCLRKGLYNE